MNKKTLKLNKLLATLILVSVVFGGSFSVAQAAFFDWFLDSSDETSPISSFGFSSLYLSPNNQINNNDQIGADRSSLVQSNSVVSVNAPVINKKLVANTRISIENSKILSEMAVAASAYSSTPDQTDSSPFITAWNTRVRDGIVAANFLPFGTKIKIPEIYGDKIFVVEDRMNRRYWHKIDVWFPDRQSALEFGSKVVKIQIVGS